MLHEDARMVVADEFPSTCSLDESYSSISEASVRVAVNGHSAIEAKRRAYDKCYSNMQRRLHRLWGPGDPYIATEEDTTTWPQWLYYTWVTRYIRIAVNEQLQASNLPPVQHKHRAHECGRVLSAAVQRSHYRHHAWSILIGKIVTCQKDRASRGVLRWVGIPQSGGFREIVAAVTWSTPPAHRVVERNAGQSRFFRGSVHGEVLFTPEEPTENSTLEDPNILQFLVDDAKGGGYNNNNNNNNNNGVENAIAATLPVPRRLSVMRDLFVALPGAVLMQIPWKMIGDVCTLTIPVLLQKYVTYLTGDTHTWSSGVALVIGLFVVQATQSAALHAFYYMGIKGGLCYRSALSSVIFEKCFTISAKSLAIPEMSTGRIINMIGSDVERANDFLQYCMYLWSSPTVFVLSIVLLYRLVGWCALVGVAAISMTLPLDAYVMRRMMVFRQRLAKVSDARVKATNEFFSGVRIAKFMTWEPHFMADIEEKRNMELRYLKQVQMCRVVVSFINNATPPVMIAVVFLLYHLTGHELTPEVVFPTISLLSIIRMPFMMIPTTVNMAVQFVVSMARISAFLECDNSPQGVENISKYLTAQSKNTKSCCEAAAVCENTDVMALVPIKLPRAPPFVFSLAAHVLRRFCCCAACLPEAHRPPLTQILHEDENEDEMQPPNNSSKTPTSKKNGKRAVEDRFQLRPKSILHNISVEVPKGKFTVVLGPTGSGKSTLLATLLGEYEVTRGHVWATRSIAYVPQQPWIMNATLRDNVLFFAPEDTRRLDEVIRVCQLESDLKLLASGMQTEIGEKGINLSGGQKARVSLARAVYADRELYLLDDPLSALDAHVGERIVTDVLLGCLAHKTRILATHQLHVLSRADHIIVLRDGRIAFSGSRAEFLLSPLHKDIVDHKDEPREDKMEGKDGDGDDEVVDESSLSSLVDATQEEAATITTAVAAPSGRRVSVKGLGDAGGEKGGDETNAKLITVEEKAVGFVPWSTYVAYIRACGGTHIALLVFVIFFLTEMLTLSSNVWLSMWSTKRFELSSETYLKVYVTLVIVGAITVPLRFSVAYSAMRRASGNLHRILLNSVSTATMQFFDTTPLGRIVNRFSRDIDRIDDALQMTFIFLMQVTYSIFSSLAVAINSQPFVIIVILPLAFVYYKLMLFYNASNREIRRVGSTIKAPLLSLLGESLVGSSTIAAFGCTQNIMQESLRRIDRLYASSFIENAANRWIGVRVELLNNIIVVFIASFGVVSTMMHFSSHDIGLISLSLTMALASTSQLNWLVRMVGSMEADMNSVERIIYYTENIEHEDMPEVGQLVADELQNRKRASSDATATVVIENNNNNNNSSSSTAEMRPNTTTKTTAGWLEFRDVEVRYRAGLPLVLNKISFRIEPRQKVGIVGRTGSGKSTLLLTFLRMVEISGGEILVSGRPIRSYGLRELRRLFSMIPQDPLLFDGTVRSNLDPFFESTVGEVQHALELVGMRERVESESGGIESRVQEGGQNYSVGQRQLLCLARALLKRGSGFILMDEATANIDHALDQQIQHTVMTAFAEHTVITIAHRLHTVALYDKIIVMDNGVVAESGSPCDLVANPSSRLCELVNALGKREAAKFMAKLGNGSPPRSK